ncbi:MAG: ADP-ribosylglycohydrolase family protein [Planctomycetia bacterium]|nr:ADP-ribosylglycohydrolase family protein [Planctomycetia bacterium]
MSTNSTDRIRGTLLGLAWGDVLGCPVESWHSADIERVYGRYDGLPAGYPLDRIRPLGPRTVQRLRPLGLHSDDTQQALALINVCLRPPWSVALWADWLVAGKRQRAWRGFGRNFSGAVSQLERGQLPSGAGSTTAGIGATMRIGPLGALYRDQPEHLAKVAFESSLVTHGDIRAGAFSYAIAAAVAALLADEPVAKIRQTLPTMVAKHERAWLNGRPEWAIDRNAGPLVSRVLAEFFATDDSDVERVRQRLCQLARPHLGDLYPKVHPNEAFVLLGGLHALALALLPEVEPQALLADIVRQGEDADTVAAIAGSLLGARCGTGWIPRDRLLDRASLERYADALVTRHGHPEERDTFLQREAEWTRQEESYQDNLAARRPGFLF